MILHAPQIILTCWFLFGMGVCASRYGQPRKVTYDLFDCLICPALVFGLLWWGGFYG